MTETVKRENILGTEPVGRLLRKFALPGIISMVVNALYNIVDQIFIGQTVGYLGNGATNAIFPLVTLAFAFAFMLGDGATSYISLMLGRKKDDEAARGAAAGIVSVTATGVIIGILYLILITPLCKLFGATPAILPYAEVYGRIIAIGLPFACISAGLSGIIRADGSPKYSMAGLLMGCVINIGLDALFLLVFNWGVAGAAWATIIGQFVNAVWNLAYMRRTKTITLTKKIFKSWAAALPQIIRLGVSSFINQIMMVLIIGVQNNALTHWGEMSVYGADIPFTALGVTMKVFNILMAICIGLAIGAQPIWGYNYGSGQYDRVKKCYRYVVTIAITAMCIAWIIFHVAPMSVISIFGNEDAMYNDFSVKCLQIFLAGIPLGGLPMVTGIFFQALGRPVQASVMSMARQLIFQIPLTLVLPRFFGVIGVLYCGCLTDCLCFVLAVVLLRVSWKKIFAEKTNAEISTEKEPTPVAAPAEETTAKKHYIITIGRSFGAGGRSVGKLLTERLNIPYYDNEIIIAAAEKSGLDARYLKSVDENYKGNAAPVAAGFVEERGRLLKEAETASRSIIEEAAAQGPCVIVGRCADHLLQEEYDVLSVFITMPLEKRIAHVCRRDGLTPEQSEKLINKVDKERATYYNNRSKGSWGNADNYNLVLDNHTYGTEGSVDIILAALKQRNAL